MTRATVEDRFVALLDQLVPDTLASLGVAVSGGPDSLALLLLAHAARPGRIHAATVDHGLRTASAKEADTVARLCADRAIPHVTLRADWAASTHQGLQAEARAHRYRLLDGWCRTAGLPALLTAHHRDDQAETLLLRIARGSGLTGLAGIRCRRPLRPGSPVMLLRPVLAWSKADLVAIVTAAGLTAIDDPSNRDSRHDRTAARALLAGGTWLDPARLAATAQHLAQAEAALDWVVDREAAVRIHRDDHGDRRFDPAGLPDELVRRLVLRCLQPGRPPRGDDVDRMIGRLRAGHAATLGTTLARPKPSHWTFCPAPPRNTR